MNGPTIPPSFFSPPSFLPSLFLTLIGNAVRRKEQENSGGRKGDRKQNQGKKTENSKDPPSIRPRSTTDGTIISRVASGQLGVFFFQTFLRGPHLPQADPFPFASPRARARQEHWGLVGGGQLRLSYSLLSPFLQGGRFGRSPQTLPLFHPPMCMAGGKEEGGNGSSIATYLSLYVLEALLHRQSYQKDMGKYTHIYIICTIVTRAIGRASDIVSPSLCLSLFYLAAT